MKRSRLPRSLRLPMKLVIVIALTSAWMPWVSPAQAAVPGWEDTGRMVYGTYKHTATLLRNGTVLIAGGDSEGFTPLSSAEVYDPGTGTFDPTEAMRAELYWPTATLLGNGKVLVAGGGTKAPTTPP